MGVLDYVLLGVIALCVIAVCLFLGRRRRKGSCSGCCQNCSGCH